MMMVVGDGWKNEMMGIAKHLIEPENKKTRKFSQT
jgi:hypothetical protein